MTQPFPALLAEISRCGLCSAHLPHGPNPVLRAAESAARVLIIGQAPGRKVHATGIPWNDPSGDRLRDWLGVDRDSFYDQRRFAIMPMGFCYPGTGKSGDLPPRPECAPAWHARVRAHLPHIRLTLLIGQYAQRYYLADHKHASLGETVSAWRQHMAQGYFPLVHPSPRNRRWLSQHPWFEAEVVPELRRLIADLGSGSETPKNHNVAQS